MGRHTNTPENVGNTVGRRVFATRRPGEVLMAARLVLFCGAVLVAMNPVVWPADTAESDVSAPVVAAAKSAVTSTTSDDVVPAVYTPSMSPKLSTINRRKISDAFVVALERVREVPECRELFTNLGADGETALSMVVFLPVGRAEARDGVCRGSSAYTLVGGGPVWVCRDFSRLSDTQAAMVIVHEALHHAGLNEYPKDPDAMTSKQINGMVMKHCGL
jgi:hypothetical protein